jgi:hypothetical protein
MTPRFRVKVQAGLAALLFFALASGTGCSSMGPYRGYRWTPVPSGGALQAFCDSKSAQEDGIRYAVKGLELTLQSMPAMEGLFLGPVLLPILPLPLDLASCRDNFKLTVKAQRPVILDFTKWEIQGASSKKEGQPCRIRAGQETLDSGVASLLPGESREFLVSFLYTHKADSEQSLVIGGVSVDGQLLESRSAGLVRSSRWYYYPLLWPGSGQWTFRPFACQ